MHDYTQSQGACIYKGLTVFFGILLLFLRCFFYYFHGVLLLFLWYFLMFLYYFHGVFLLFLWYFLSIPLLFSQYFLYYFYGIFCVIFVMLSLLCFFDISAFFIIIC